MMAAKMVTQTLICGKCYFSKHTKERGYECLHCTLKGQAVQPQAPLCSEWVGDLSALYARKVANRMGQTPKGASQ